jgi:tRNA (guanine-N7-)-methyltransferase
MPLKHHDVFYDPTAIQDRGINPFLSRLKELGETSEKIVFGPRLREKRGQWQTKVFGHNISQPSEPRQIWLEIGSYKGSTLLHFAKSFPDSSWVGMDITFKRVFLTGQKICTAKLSNAAVIMARASADGMREIFESGELDGVMIFFPDPWSRLSQRHNRLVTLDFLTNLKPLIRPGGYFWFKSDQKDYFEEVVSFAEQAGFIQLASPELLPCYSPERTPFEQRFHEVGDPTFTAAWQRPVDS